MAISEEDDIHYETSTTTVLILFFCLLLLSVLLIGLYKKLSSEANGKYTIQHMVYREGGLRDQVRGAALAVGPRLGFQLWPYSDTDEEEGEEMQEVRVEEGHAEEGSSHSSYSEGDEGEDKELVKTNGKGSANEHEDSISEGSEAGEQPTGPKDQQKARRGTGEEERQEKEKRGEASGGQGLLVDLKQFSGSVTWSEDGPCRDSDVTAL